MWSGKIGYGIWYEKLTVVNGKWLWMVYAFLLDLCSVDIFCAVTGLCATFVGGILRVFDEINLYIALNSFVDRVVLVI